MIALAPSLLAIGGARTGIAPANLLEIQDVNGNYYFWADRAISAPSVFTASQLLLQGAPVTPVPLGQSVMWFFPAEAPVNGNPRLNVGIGAGGTYTATYDGFASPIPLPAGAAVQAMYGMAALEVAGDGDVAASGPGMTFPSGNTWNGRYVGTNLGTDISAIGTYAFTFEIATNPFTAESETLSVTFVGIAVYYTVPGQPGGSGPYGWAEGAGWAEWEPWLLSVPQYQFHRSLQTDVGSFVVQNLSGDTLSRDVEKILRRSAIEGSQFVWTLWQPDALAAWFSVHGTLTVDPVGVDTLTLKGSQLLNPSQDDTPLEAYGESCQLQWAGPRCGSTESTECDYSFQSCQVPQHIMVTLNDYEKNYGEALANTTQQVINRARKF